MKLPQFHAVFNTSAALHTNSLWPVKVDVNQLPVTCCNCSFINKANYNFCTNCGFPVHPNKDSLARYNERLIQRKNLQKNCYIKIARARNTLYILAAFCMLGIFYLFSDWKQSVIKGVVMVCLGVIYAGLGSWSVQKPFTSLLISLIIMLTFVVINTWAEFSSAFVTAAGIYMLIVQVILIYFLLQGVKGAFHADILEEEFKL
jgi:hypothetical protein